MTKWMANVQSEFTPFYQEAHKIIEQTADEYQCYVDELNK